jgi:hypothetical protein
MKENYNDNINSFIVASFDQVLSVGNKGLVPFQVICVYVSF